MLRPTFDENWPESWKLSYHYDRMEVFGEDLNRGYTYAYRERFHHTMDLLQKVTPIGGSILDVAAAQGNFSIALAEQGYQVTWNDIRAELYGYVGLKGGQKGIAASPGDLFSLPEKEIYDVVLIAEVIEHVAHPDRFLRKAAKLVKPGGHIVATTPNGAFFRNQLPKFSECPDPEKYESEQFQPDANGHIFLLQPEELAGLAQDAGLELVETRLFTNPLTNGVLKTRRLLSVLPKKVVEGIEHASCLLPENLKEKGMMAMVMLLHKPAA